MNVQRVTCDEVRREYDDVVTFYFGKEEIEYTAGMMAHVVAPSGGGVRHLSFASAPGEDRLMFSMDLASRTPFKRAMAALGVGDTIDLFKIKGKFLLKPPASLGFPQASREEGVVFLGGGIGITPIRSLIHSIEGHGHGEGEGVPWSLVHVARGGNHLFEAELTQAFPDARQMRTDHEGCGDALAAITADQPAALYYVCGSARFIEGMAERLVDLGIPRDRVRTENFKVQKPQVGWEGEEAKRG